MAGKTAFILLAAGASQRMGRVKQLMPLQNRPALLFALDRIMAGGCENLVVVLGHHRLQILPHLEAYAVTVTINEHGGQMSDSVRTGLTAVSEEVSGIFVGLADHPLVRPSTYRYLQSQHVDHPNSIIIPTCNGRGGHPTLFPADLLPRNLQQPLNSIVATNRDRVLRLPVDDPGTVFDMDRYDDYLHLAGLAERESSGSAQ